MIIKILCVINLEFDDPAVAQSLTAALTPLSPAEVAVIGDPAAPTAVLLSPQLFELLAADIERAVMALQASRRLAPDLDGPEAFDGLCADLGGDPEVIAAIRDEDIELIEPEGQR